MVQPFTLCLQWERFADKCQLWTWKGQLISPLSNQSPSLVSKVLLLSCIYLTFFPSDLIPAIQVCNISTFDLPGFILLSLLRFALITSLFTPSSDLCTSMAGFRALFWMMCWPTLLHPAWHFLTPMRVLPLAPASAAIGSTAVACPGSQGHLSRSFLLLFAWNPPVCYPGALTPPIYLLHSKYFDCPVSVFVPESVALRRPFDVFNNNYPDLASEDGWNGVITGAGGHSCNSYLT